MSGIVGDTGTRSGSGVIGQSEMDCGADGWCNQMTSGGSGYGSPAILDFQATTLGRNITESGGQITVGKAGWYFVSVHLSKDSTTDDTTHVRLRKNGSNQNARLYSSSHSEVSYASESMSALVECASGDTIDWYGEGTFFSDSTAGDAMTVFTGFRVGR